MLLTIKVRFNETDQMNYLYHGNYASYYHVSRTELLRGVGLSDKSLEIDGIILPVIELQSKYIKPAFYDDELNIKTVLHEVKGCKLHFNHEVYNSKKELINIGSTIVAYINKTTRKPIKIPQPIKEMLNFLIKQ